MNERFTSVSLSLKGEYRPVNQDRVLVINGEGYRLYALFDGVSSYPDSYRYIAHYIQSLQQQHVHWLTADGHSLERLLYQAYLEGRDFPVDGSTTLSVLLLPDEGDKAFFVNIGDSRIYRFMGHDYQQLTEDDNLPDMPNILTRWVGKEYLSPGDFRIHDVSARNHFLICSDGFYSMMEENRKAFFDLFVKADPAEAAKGIDALVRHRNSDDASYILIKNRELMS